MNVQTRVLFPLLLLIMLGGCVVVAGTPVVKGVVAGDSREEGRASWHERRIEVAGVREVVMRAHGRLRVAQGKEDRLTIRGPRAAVESVRVVQRGRALTIDDRAGFELDFGPLLTVNLPPEVQIELILASPEAIRLEGHGDIEVDDLSVDSLWFGGDGNGHISAGTLRVEHFVLAYGGDGEVHITELVAGRADLDLTGHGEFSASRLITRDLGITVDGHGSARVAGVADQQRVRVDGHADYRGGGLNSREARVSVHGKGQASVWVQELLAREVADGAALRLDGQPRVVELGAQAERAG